MAIIVSVQYNGGFSPDMIPTCYYHHRGTLLNAMSFFVFAAYDPTQLNVLSFFPLPGGCSEGLDAFI